MKAIKLKRSDVTVTKLEPVVCNKCGRRATHLVTIDFRNAGFLHGIDVPLCKEHAEELAQEIREAL